MAERLTDRVMVVTGASRGIGEQIALACAGEKAKLVLVARTPEDLERVRGRAMEAGSEDVLTVTTDITKEEEVEVMYDVILSRFGRVDILVNNAGIAFFKSVLDTTAAEWQAMFDLNVKGLFLCSRGAVAAMKEQGGGHIINISSVAGREPIANFAGYSATKYAVQGFADALRQEVRSFGIKVTNILPGFTATEATGVAAEQAYEKGAVKPGDVAQAVVFAAAQPKQVLIHELVITPTVEAEF
ncbi:SDR family oxidoreductase [Effusibacillus dendaii]|uniref:Clavaldehyde dehydrogenase n=1 Tax=Effusibacillus dendaii TaxID=2743772 RepID=A0A7I8DD22_9BACL|nr:SDR family oxidoreductase [Effusibacillus dendaii]BCJ87182.1 clavaldehyde dehydrogenase [Effusibacillus dendaii]